MKRYLVFCKDQKQWDDYVETHRFCVETSNIFTNTLTIDIRENSFIITDNHGNQSAYIKMIPCENYRKSFPLWYGFGAEKVWLCDENEFVNLAFVDKYL